MMPELPEVKSLPALTSAAPGRLRKPQLPMIGSGFSMRSGAAEEAAKYAQDMGTAFAYSNLQKRQSSARARALSKAVERQSRRQGKEIAKRGRRAGRYERQADYRTALNEARIRGIGPELFKRARL
jgi:hypothetical protein